VLGTRRAVRAVGFDDAAALLEFGDTDAGELLVGEGSAAMAPVGQASPQRRQS
jgi:hypothetical protein